MLRAVLGLTAAQDHAYREIVGSPSLDANELAQRMGSETIDANAVLQVLEQHGLVSRQSGGNGRFQAAPPQIALGALLARRADEMRQAQDELMRLEDEYRRSSAQRPETDVVEVVHGTEAVRQRLLQLQMGAQHRVDAFVRMPVLALDAAENDAEDQAVARGVQYRVIVDRSMLDFGNLTVDALRLATESGEQVRIAESVPLKGIIIDGRLGCVPIASADASSAPTTVGSLLIHEGALLDGLIALFESVWRDSAPFVPEGAATGGVLAAEAQDLTILGLLLAGLTDQAVANKLNLSARSVQRRVKVLMDLAGVSSRVQLGWFAARNGWLPS
jgi:sugar-specific transcriptional regulator TrmB/DNA-binding CsgD family transcriptional regulator